VREDRKVVDNFVVLRIFKNGALNLRRRTVCMERDKANPMAHDQGAKPFEAYRGYLLMLARLQMDASLQRIIDPSDVVQQTLLRAHERREQFRGESDGERAAWLRQILARSMIDALRKYGRESDRRGQSVELALEQSSCRLDALLAASTSSPGAKAEHQEQLMRLATALDRLPEDQRRAVELRHLNELPIAEIGRLMDRTTAAVGGLIQRGLRSLRAMLEDPESHAFGSRP
jgi:RNA polymerase sigma-70 factor (ECF subfamily)